MTGFFTAIAAGFGLGHLGLTILGQQQDGGSAQIAKAPRVPASPEPEAAPPLVWPDVFGRYEPQPPAPEPAPEPEAEPQPPQALPEYVLRGLFASQDNSWAIVSDPVGEYLLRVGDELPGGALVDEITEDGVWLQTGQGRALIAFDDEN